MKLHSDIARAAQNMISAHGSRAALVAQRRAENLRLAGTPEAAEAWEQIARAIRAAEDLLARPLRLDGKPNRPLTR